MTLETFDPQAEEELRRAEDYYYHSAGRHYEQGRFHTDFHAPDNIGRIYSLHLLRLQKLIYAHFRSASEHEQATARYSLDGVIADAEQQHHNSLRITAWSDMLTVNSGFLPTLPKDKDPFAQESGATIEAKMVTFEPPHSPHTDTLMTVKKAGNTANVCFTHLPGYHGCSPMNAVESLATELLNGELKGYKFENVRFFIHVPSECGIQGREDFIEAKLEKSGSRFLTQGRISVKNWVGLEGKPACIDQIVYTHFDRPEDIEKKVESWVHSGNDDEFDIRSMRDTHSAQVHRRFVVATREPSF